MKHLVKIYVVLLIFIIFVIGFFSFSLHQTQKKLTHNIDTLFIAQAKELSQNIELKLHQEIDHDIYKQLEKHPQLRAKLENTISTMTTSFYKYIYVLYRDVHGDYRFLIDGSKEDKGEFREKFNIAKDKWDIAYQNQEPKLLYQKHLHSLWVTYLDPVVFHGKTEAIIAMDFSTKLPKSIAIATKPFSTTLVYVFLAITLLLFILFYQTFLNFRVKKESITDTLTQIYNRTYLRELLEDFDSEHYQVIMFDIDYFKQVNDTYGHKMGDNILRDLALLIKKEIRENDIFIRFGGEEFLLFVYRKEHDKMFAYNIAQRLRKKIEQTDFIYDEVSIHITVSMGVTCSPERFKMVSSAIKYADEMLYIAKKEGRNQVIHTPKLQKKHQVVEQYLTINEIKDAIEDDRILCHFQAIFNAKTGEIVKYEALVRLRTREGEIVAPVAFLQNIRHTNLYNDMSKKIFDIVFDKIKTHQIAISINMTFSDILNNDIFMLILKEIKAHQACIPFLTIELLEYEALELNDTFVQHIQAIKSYGIHIAIDDFGIGFANYNILQTLPLDTIKIDGSLMKDIDTSSTSFHIVKSIILLADALHIETVAECVHSKDVYTIVNDLGVTYMQGYYLAKPQEYFVKQINDIEKR
jgi:diguanylate cyclase (GGDEF)-like protein